VNDAPEFFDAPERAATATALAEEFRGAFGTDPAGVWSAPGRVNLIGEHVDYTGGLCLPLALPHRTFVALRPRTDGVVRVRSRQESAGEVVVALSDTPPTSARAPPTAGPPTSPGCRGRWGARSSPVTC
jgi:galactokinase